MTVRMKAPEGASGFSFDGEGYKVVDGFAEVPQAAVTVLLSHGYTVAEAGEEHAKRKRRSAAEVAADKASMKTTPEAEAS